MWFKSSICKRQIGQLLSLLLAPCCVTVGSALKACYNLFASYSQGFHFRMFDLSLDFPIGLCCGGRTCLFDCVSCTLLVLAHLDAICLKQVLALEDPGLQHHQSLEVKEKLQPSTARENRDSMYSLLSDHKLSSQIVSSV